MYGTHVFGCKLVIKNLNQARRKLVYYNVVRPKVNPTALVISWANFRILVAEVWLTVECPILLVDQ